MKFAVLCMCVLLSIGFANRIYAITEDFSDGDDGWTQIQGSWSVKNGEYVQEDPDWTTTTTNETYHRSYYGDETWANYTVEAKVRIDSGGDLAPIIGIFFRVTEKSEAGDYYYFRLDTRPAEGPALVKSPNTILQENMEKPANVGQEYILKVEVSGDNIRCYVDGQLEIELQDDSFPMGAVGVGTFNTDGYFDDIVIGGDDVMAAVSANDKLATTWASIKN